MKRRKIRSKLVCGIVTASILTSACAAAMPCCAAANETSVNFDDGIGLPWHAVASAPAQLDFDISDGTYNITIVNCGGEANGGQSRWDCQFVHRGLQFRSGDSYTVKAEVTTDQTGEIYTKIGNLAGDIELWHNGYGEANPSYGIGWNCIKLKAGQTLKIDSTWTSPRDLDVAEWAWQFGGAGPHQETDCFPAGTVLKFDNLSIVDNTRSKDGTGDLLTWEGWTRNDCNDPYSVDGSPAVAVNHKGYFTKGAKKATVHANEAFEKQKIKLVNAETLAAVYQKTVSSDALDAESGQYTAEIDFTAVKESGEYFFMLGNNIISPEFTIGDDIYDELLTDSLNYFDLNHTQKESDSKTQSAYLQSDWRKNGEELDMDKQLTLPNGWYDSADTSRNTIEGAYAAWTLQNLCERAGKHDSENFSDDKMLDLLEEARLEVVFLLNMMIPEDETGANMAYHEIKTLKASTADGGTANIPIVQPATTSATLNVAAVAAQAARLWRDNDEEFTKLCLEKAEAAFAAACDNEIVYAPVLDKVGTDLSEDKVQDDEFFWAASELYATTGKEEYLEKMTAFQKNALSYKDTYEYYVMSPTRTAAQGVYSLLLNDKADDTIKKEVTDIADALIKMEAAQGFGLPYQANPSVSELAKLDFYSEQSNGKVAANAMLLAYAYDLTEDASYLNGATQGLDYLLGRNALNFSYVTGDDERSVKHPIHFLWNDSESVPNGILVGGPTGYELTDYMTNAGYKVSSDVRFAPQTFYADSLEAYTLNEASATLNAPLAWLVSFLADHADVDSEATEKSEEIQLVGDANSNGVVDISDAILVFRIAAEDTSVSATENGTKFADVDEDGKLTAADAAEILKIIARLR